MLGRYAYKKGREGHRTVHARTGFLLRGSAIKPLPGWYFYLRPSSKRDKMLRARLP
jgi:hypothetical protein